MGRRPGLDRETVVQAAAAIANTSGLSQVTLVELASRLQVRTPSLYNHIDGLDGLRRELALLGLRELGSRLQRAAVGKAGDGALTAMLLAYRSFATEWPGVYEATLRAPNEGDGDVAQVAGTIVDTVLTVLEPYGLSTDDAIHVVRGFRAVGHGFASLEAAGAFGMALSRDESYEQLILIFLEGLHAICKVQNE